MLLFLSIMSNYALDALISHKPSRALCITDEKSEGDKTRLSSPIAQMNFCHTSTNCKREWTAQTCGRFHFAVNFIWENFISNWITSFYSILFNCSIFFVSSAFRNTFISELNSLSVLIINTINLVITKQSVRFWWIFRESLVENFLLSSCMFLYSCSN